MEIALTDHLLRFDPAGAWEVAKGWGDPSLHATHGLYLASVEHGVELHVREQRAGPFALTEAGLVDLLRDQRWASPPFDERVTRHAGVLVVGGTFEAPRSGEVVREWFVTNGRVLANVAMPGARSAVAAALPSAERLVATLRFDPMAT